VDFNTLSPMLTTFVMLFSLGTLFTISALALVFCFLIPAYSVSELISELGTYHRLCNFNSPFGETFGKKIKRVYFTNLKLSGFIIVTIIFLIATIMELKNTNVPSDIDIAYFAVAVICPGYLLSLRLLANPVRIVPRFPVPFSSFECLARPNDNYLKIKTIKEKYVSFYFSMILTVLFTLVILYVYLVSLHGSDLSNYFIKFFTSLVPTYDLVKISVLIIVFLLTLFFTTFIGEWFLRKYEVMMIEEFS
jgi:hypothetical protein